MSTDPVRRAVIPCGGKGTRMRALTGGAPKELLEVAGEPLLVHVLRECGAAGVVSALVLIAPGNEAIVDVVAPLAGRFSDKVGSRWLMGAGLVLLSLYGSDSPVGIDLAYTEWGVMVALLFITLPFVVRSVQPTLIELDKDMEEAAASLGASRLTTFRRIIRICSCSSAGSGSGLFSISPSVASTGVSGVRSS